MHTDRLTCRGPSHTKQPARSCYTARCRTRLRDPSYVGWRMGGLGNLQVRDGLRLMMETLDFRSPMVDRMGVGALCFYAGIALARRIKL